MQVLIAKFGNISQRFLILRVSGLPMMSAPTPIRRHCAVTSVDGMTAEWAQIPHEVLDRIANRIIREVDGKLGGLRYYIKTASDD